jgi:hypothetical protein
MRARIREEIEDQTAAAKPASAKRSARIPARSAAEDDESRHWVVIQQSEGDQYDVQLTVNGVTCLVRRGEPVYLRQRYVEALQNAVQTRWRQDERDGLVSVEVPAYPFSFVAAPRDKVA